MSIREGVCRPEVGELWEWLYPYDHHDGSDYVLVVGVEELGVSIEVWCSVLSYVSIGEEGGIARKSVFVGD